MAGITLAQAEANLTTWIDASAAIASNQSYTITSGESTRTLTRANLGEARKMIEFWQGWVNKLSPTTRQRTRYGVPA